MDKMEKNEGLSAEVCEIKLDWPTRDLKTPKAGSHELHKGEGPSNRRASNKKQRNLNSKRTLREQDEVKYSAMNAFRYLKGCTPNHVVL